VAQPGESQGRPHTTAGAKPIREPACPQLASDTGPLSRSPERTPGSAALVRVFHSRYDAAKRPAGAAKGNVLSLSAEYDRAGKVTAEGRTFLNITGDAGSNVQHFAYG
jgi:hypothetical protein